MEKRRNCSSSFSHYFIYILLTAGVKLHIHLLRWLFNLLFSSLSQLWYVEVRISRSVSVSPLEFEITRVDCSFSTDLSKAVPLLQFFFVLCVSGFICGVVCLYLFLIFPSSDALGKLCFMIVGGIAWLSSHNFLSAYEASWAQLFKALSCVSYITGASNWYWLTVGQGLLSL